MTGGEQISREADRGLGGAPRDSLACESGLVWLDVRRHFRLKPDLMYPKVHSGCCAPPAPCRGAFATIFSPPSRPVFKETCHVAQPS
jgi:hypothetical protein